MSMQPEYLPWTEYVYLWVCNTPGGTYVKIGVTNNPNRRATEFRTNSPFRASRHLICQYPDKPAAFKLEKTLLSTFRAWRMRGEWVRVEANRLDAFVQACTAIARQEISERVMFRDHKPRRPNGESFNASTASDSRRRTS